jgi:hypothetical protein
MDVLVLIDARMAKIKKIVKFHYSVNELSWNVYVIPIIPLT